MRVSCDTAPTRRRAPARPCGDDWAGSVTSCSSTRSSRRENLTFFARLQGVDDVGARVRRALADARLDSRAGDLVSGFSRGMRQRLALERALLHDPRLLLLDEPFTGLDGPSTTALGQRLARLASEGRLVMLATHDVDLAGDVLTRALILRDGRLVDDISGRGWRQSYRAALSRES